MVRLSRHPVRLHYLLYYLFLSPCRQNHGKPWCETKAKGTCNQTASQRKIITQLKEQRVKPSMAYDIWSDSHVSLMGTFS